LVAAGVGNGEARSPARRLLADETVYAAAGGEMPVCLDRALTLEAICAIAERTP
jgi:hypothetical protein